MVTKKKKPTRGSTSPPTKKASRSSIGRKVANVSAATASPRTVKGSAAAEARAGSAAIVAAASISDLKTKNRMAQETVVSNDAATGIKSPTDALRKLKKTKKKKASPMTKSLSRRPNPPKDEASKVINETSSLSSPSKSKHSKRNPSTPKKSPVNRKIGVLSSPVASMSKGRSSAIRRMYSQGTSPGGSTTSKQDLAMTPSPSSTKSKKRTPTSISSTVRRVKNKLVIDEDDTVVEGKGSVQKQISQDIIKKSVKLDVNQVNWKTEEGLDEGLGHFYDNDDFEELDVREKISMLCGCYTPSESKSMYMLLCFQAGESIAGIDLNCLKGKKQVGNAMADVICKVMNQTADLSTKK